MQTMHRITRSYKSLGETFLHDGNFND